MTRRTDYPLREFALCVHRNASIEGQIQATVRAAFRKQLKGCGLPGARIGVNTQAFFLQEQMVSEFLLGYRFGGI
jgi:hypothetical protein